MPTLQEWRGDDGAVVRYTPVRSFGKVWVAAGLPSSSRTNDVVAFERAAAVENARVLWFAVESPEFIDGSRPSIVIGAEPVWSSSRWDEIVSSKRSVRAQIARARNKGLEVEQWDSARVSASAELRTILEDWLSRRGLPPLSFMANPYVLQAPGPRTFHVAVLEGEPVGYLAMVPGDEALIEWIIQHRRAPNGTAAMLLDAAVRSLPHDSTFTLGMVPLSSYAPLSTERPGPLVRALLSWVRAHATRFYNFEGLERFKAKFVPDYWRPLWLVTDGRPINVLTFHAVAAAFSSSRGPTRFVARALGDAVLEEARRLGASSR
ncbi:phosphatidylglycerol lysyltransferase domain-containing protein [Rubrivirga sp.]|uniref:phosphatidylglycerol lysyltransferase domain-containing protein n=1 Tax=Rubrivirga sp. TaxID=1885344 RepID=UPI003C70B7E2